MRLLRGPQRHPGTWTLFLAFSRARRGRRLCAKAHDPGSYSKLDWIEEAKLLKRKAIISSAFESPVGFKVLANLACLSGQIAGLGTERWFKKISSPSSVRME